MTKDEQIEQLLKQNEELMRALKSKPSSTVSYERQTTSYRSEPSLMEKVVDGAAFGVGFSLVDNAIDSLFN